MIDDRQIDRYTFLHLAFLLQNTIIWVKRKEERKYTHICIWRLSLKLAIMVASRKRTAG